MITWSCKAPLVALALTGLAACEGGLPGGAASGKQNVALLKARMAFGAVTLVAPEGYCIDQRTLKQRFALMARCDRLGVPSQAGDAPIGVITASFSNAERNEGPPSSEQIVAAFNLPNLSSERRTQTSVLFKATGAAPTEGLGSARWRGSARIGTQMMGLALYGPQNGRADSAEGRAILSDLIAKSTAELETPSVTVSE